MEYCGCCRGGIATMPTMEGAKDSKIARNGTNTGIPGLSFSWKRALGITNAKRTIARKTGIPTTKAGVERKIRKTLIKTILVK